MPDIEETVAFKTSGGYNSDDDPRAMPDGDYTKAYNGYIGPTVDGKRGVAEGMRSNEKLLEGVNDDGVSIGSGRWEAQDGIVYLLFRNGADGAIKVYFPGTGVTETLFSGDLNLSNLNPANKLVITDNKARWTDNRNAPREINLLRALNGVGNVYEDGLYAALTVDDLFTLKKPPLFSPELMAFDNDTDLPITNLENKLIQFAYSFVYLDGEESVVSPYSPEIKILGAITDTVHLKMATGSHMVRQIKVYYRYAAAPSVYYRAGVFNKYKADGTLADDGFGITAENDSHFIYSFIEVDLQTTRAESDMIRHQYLVPRLAGSVFPLGADGFRLGYADYLEGLPYVRLQEDTEITLITRDLETQYLNPIEYLSDRYAYERQANGNPSDMEVQRVNGSFNQVGGLLELTGSDPRTWRYKWTDSDASTKYVYLSLHSGDAINHRVNEVLLSSGSQYNFYVIVNNKVYQSTEICNTTTESFNAIANLVYQATGELYLTHPIQWLSDSAPRYALVETGIEHNIEIYVKNTVYGNFNPKTEFRDTQPYRYDLDKVYQIGIVCMDQHKHGVNVTTSKDFIIKTPASETFNTVIEIKIKNFVPPEWAHYWFFVRTSGVDVTTSLNGEFFPASTIYEIENPGTADRRFRVYTRPQNFGESNTQEGGGDPVVPEDTEYAAEEHYLNALIPYGDRHLDGTSAATLPITYLHLPDDPGGVRLNAITVGGPYVDNGLINKISEFKGDITRSFSSDYGRIVGVESIGDTLKIQQESKLSSIYVDREVQFSGGGNQQVYKDQILSKVSYRNEDWGCSHGGSIHIIKRSVLGCDLEKGVIWRDSANGTFDVSSYKFKARIREIASHINVNEFTKRGYIACSGFHPRTDQYWLTFNSENTWLKAENVSAFFTFIAFTTDKIAEQVSDGDLITIFNEDEDVSFQVGIHGSVINDIGNGQLSQLISIKQSALTSAQLDFMLDDSITKYIKANVPDKSFTLTFNESNKDGDGNRFDAEMTWHPEQYVEMDSIFYTFKKGLLYRQDFGDFFGTGNQRMYGELHPFSITVPLNKTPTENKVYNALKVQGTGNFLSPLIEILKTDSYPSGMRSRIPNKLFKLVEGFYQAAFLRDMNSRGDESDEVKLVNGRELRGSVALVTIESTAEDRLTQVASIKAEESLSLI